MNPHEPNASPTPPNRRHLLRSALALPAAIGFSRLESGQGGPEVDDLEAFFDRWVPRARALAAQESPEEDAFLYELCADVVGRAPGFFPRRRLTIYEGAGMKTGPVGRDDVFQLIELELEPGTRVPAHNHSAYAFVTLCLEGEVRVRNYEPEPGAPDAARLEQDFLVREVQDLLLRPGRVSTLSRSRANVHALEAGPAGARVLEFGLKFPSPGDGPKVFSVLELDPEPADSARAAYTARWIGNVYAAGYERERDRK